MRSALILLAAILLVGTGCRKLKHSESGSVTTVTNGDSQITKPVAGKGGNASMRITPNHDTLNIDSVLVFIKYDAQVVPFDGKYDDSVWAKNITGIPYATFTGLKPGNYYVFGRGWDLVRSLKISGGMPFTILDANANAVHTFTLPMQEYE